MISNDHASTLAATLASVLTKFIKHSSLPVSQIDLLQAQMGKHLNRQCSDSQTMTGVEQEDIRHILDEHPALQRLIDERVREVVKELFKAPTLATQDSSAPTGIGEGSLPLEVQDLSIEADVSSTSGEDSFKEEITRRSMTALVNRRGRSAHLEQKLLCLWGSILDQAEDSISKHDSFFELGGDSIAAMRLVGAAREEGLILTVADVFRNPVFEDMAAIVQIASGMSTIVMDTDIRDFTGQNISSYHAVGSELYQRFAVLEATNVDDAFLQSRICPRIGVFRGGIADVLPVTDFQALAITGALLDSRWMLNYFYLDGRGPLDLRRLKQSCFCVVQAFDILRTVFVCFKDRFLQVILRKMRPEFFVYDTENSLEEFTAMLQQRDREQSPRQGEPFVQFIVAKEKASDRHRILIRLSHAQYDGVSLPKILSAIKAGYEGGPIPSTQSFANYVRTVAKTTTSDHYQHWKDLLKDSHMTDIVPRQGPSYDRSTGAVTTLKRSIRLPSMAHGNITTATVIKSVWALTLARLTAKSDIVFGHTISGRNSAVPGVETMIGPCMNVIPVRIQFKENWTVLDLLRQVQDQQVANMPFEALGFREIIKHCTDWPDWTNFSTMVQHQNVSRQEKMHLGDNAYQVGAVGSNEDFTDLTIVSIPRDTDMVELTLSYCPTSVITPSFAEKVLDMVCSAAESFTANPSMLLPSPLALSTQPSEIIDDLVKPEDEQFPSSQLKDLTRAEILVLSDVISRTWQQVLSDRDGNCPAFQLNSSFFDLNGDIISLAQLAWLLEQEDFKAPLEALVDHPSMLGQMAVLALHNSADKNQGSSSIGWSMAASLAVGESSPARKAWGKKSWATAMSLARKMVRRNARNTLKK
jgi:aryl carrier-like protein